LKVQANSDKGHEIEADCAEKESDGLVDESQNVEYKWSFFSGIILSVLSNFKFHVLASGNSVIH
jgi:hypothetical protein